MEDKGDNTTDINKNWKRELGIKISDDDWLHIWRKTEYLHFITDMETAFLEKHITIFYYTKNHKQAHLSAPLEKIWRHKHRSFSYFLVLPQS